MEFITKPWRVINRFGKRYEANSEWVIVADTKEVMEVFVAYWLEPKEKPEPKKPLKSKK
jgi:hypothetical protein